jgi:hypothetical protein
MVLNSGTGFWLGGMSVVSLAMLFIAGITSLFQPVSTSKGITTAF